jgi:hypothetical protein
MRKWVDERLGMARQIIKERLSKLTVGTFVVLVAFGIPNLFGYAQFWHSVWIWSAPRLWSILGSPIGRLVVVVCGLLVIWWDQRRITNNLHKGKQHDEKTLKGRTLKLRDELEAFLTKLGKQPPLLYESQQSAGEFAAVNMGHGLWVDKLQYGFLLNFNDRLMRLHLEFGECGKAYLPLAVTLDSQQAHNEASVRKIIEMLETMAASL